MTRDNLLELADRIGLYADQPEMPATAIVGDMRYAHRVHRLRARRDREPRHAGRHDHRRRLRGADRGVRGQGRQRAGQPGAAGERAAPHRPRRRHLELLPGRGRPAGRRGRAPVRAHRRDEDRERRRAARQPDRPPRPAAARAGAAARARARGGGAAEPARHRGLGVRAHRPLGRGRRSAPRRRSSRRCRASCAQQRAIYAPTSPPIRLLETRIAALRGPGRRAARDARGAARRRGQRGAAAVASSTSSWRRSTTGSSSSPRRRR